MRPIQEVTGARFLHDLGPRVATHVTEAIVTEDDGAVLHPRVGYDKLSTCIRVKQRERKRVLNRLNTIELFANNISMQFF